MKYLLFIAMMAFVIHGMAQTTVNCTFRLVDKDLGKPIQNAAVTINSIGIQELTNTEGIAVLDLPNSKLSLRISHVSFKDSTIYLNLKNIKEDSIQMNIYLEYDRVQLNTAVVEDAEILPDTVFGSIEYHVADFAFLKDQLLLLTYEREDRWKRQDESKITLYHNNKLILFDEEKKELDTLNINEPAIGFYTDYLNDVFLITKKAVYSLQSNDEQISLIELAPNDFQDYIKPVFDSINQHLLFSSWTNNFPAFDYYSFSLKDSSIQHLKRVEDELQMQLLRSEYKYLDTRSKLNAYRLELKTGIDKEIIAAQMSGFSNSLYAETLYAPCFVISDSILVFDHYSKQMNSYNTELNASDSVSLNYMGSKDFKDWSKKLLNDPISDDVFSLYERHGYSYLKKVDLKSANTLWSRRLSYRYPENIKVHNSKVYYIYRPFESSQKRYLYSEEID